MLEMKCRNEKGQQRTGDVAHLVVVEHSLSALVACHVGNFFSVGYLASQREPNTRVVVLAYWKHRERREKWSARRGE